MSNKQQRVNKIIIFTLMVLGAVSVSLLIKLTLWVASAPRIGSVCVLAASLVLSPIVHASDLGVIGPTYPILEEDLLVFIQTRVQAMHANGLWQTVQSQMRARAECYRDRPVPVSGITATTETRQWRFNPSVVLDGDLVDQAGHCIAPHNTVLNPLRYHGLSKALIFYNADSVQQVQWALALNKKLRQKDKLILVQGSLLTEEKRFGKPIYFDQAGHLTTHFGIRHVPAWLKQEGDQLLITEEKL